MRMVVAGLLLPAGCSDLSNQQTAPEPVRVEAPPNNSPVMTPAELGRRFRATYARGIELTGHGQYGLALGEFERAALLRPYSADALFNVGACHEALGDPLRAINVYRRVLEITPDDPDCYANLGTSFIKMYHREKSPVWRKMARQSWRRSLELSSDQPEVRAFLARSESLD